jgi:hypothetical protein
MKKITLGLAPRTNGFYDPHTNTNFLGANAKPKELYISEEQKDAIRYLNLYAACVKANSPLVLYEGSFPESVVNLYKEKMNKILPNKQEVKFEQKFSEKINTEEKKEEVKTEEVIEVAEKILEEHEKVFEALATEEKKEERTYNKKYNKKNK